MPQLLEGLPDISERNVEHGVDVPVPDTLEVSVSQRRLERDDDVAFCLRILKGHVVQLVPVLILHSYLSSRAQLRSVTSTSRRR